MRLAWEVVGWRPRFMREGTSGRAGRAGWVCDGLKWGQNRVNDFRKEGVLFA